MATKDKAPDTGERIKALIAQAETGVKSVYESDNYRKYLSAMSKFHTYSFRNTLLIMAQCPDATRVAGYNAWQDKFNRHVLKGEKGICIMGYAPRTVTTIQQKKDDSGKVLTGPDGKPETEKVEKKVPAFTPVYVFDISQTEGDPLPQLVYNLEGKVGGFKKLMSALQHVSPFPIQFEEIEGGARGYCKFEAQRIAIQQGMSEAQTIKTAIHEITHAHLHGPGIDRDRHTEEVEAESMAFIVSDHYGVDTSDYSFPYLASWSSGRELAELSASLDTIQHKAFELIEGIDAQLRELTKERELSQEQPTSTEQGPVENTGSGHSASDVEQITQGTFEKGLEAMQTAYANVGVVTWANGETKVYQDTEPFIAVIKEELPYRSSSGFAFFNLSSDPLVCKALDDLIYNEYGDENPCNMESYEYHATLAAQMNALGFERTYIPGFSKDFMMWKDTATGKTFGLDGWDGVKARIEEFNCEQAGTQPGIAPVPQPHASAKPKGIKAVMALAQARAEERAAARAEAKNQMLLSPDGRREM